MCYTIIVKRGSSMSYESRLYVVEKSSIGENMKWAEVVATINMSSMGQDFFTEINKYAPTDCYFYNNEGEVTEDMYGDPLTEVPITDMIEILGKISVDNDYRRLSPMIGLLKGFDLSQWNNLVVLHFGY